MKTDAAIAGKKIQMMRASVRCLTFGLLSLLPLIGVGFSLAALWLSAVASRTEKLYWNAARPHRIVGLICAAFGGLIWGGVDTVIIYQIYNLH